MTVPATPAEIAQSLLRKANSDWSVAQLCLQNQAFDHACFHAQQAAEKYLKAYLALYKGEWQHTHSMKLLVGDCCSVDPAFSTIESTAEGLSPYAVVTRYDIYFWPTVMEAEQAIEAAYAVRQFVIERIPDTLHSP